MSVPRICKFDPFWTDLIQKSPKIKWPFLFFLKMWQLFIVTFFDWWEIQFGQVWSSLIHFGRIWSKKIKNKTAIFILFKNVTTLYTNIFWSVQPLRSFFSDTPTDERKPHRHRSSNSSLDYAVTLRKLLTQMQ